MRHPSRGCRFRAKDDTRMNRLAFSLSIPTHWRVARLAAAMWFTTCLPAVLSTAHAQALAGPSEVVLYIHSEMKRTDFVERLECALKHILVAPVSTQDLQLALGRDLLASPTQLDVQKVADKFIQATARDGGPRTFKYLLLPFDLKDSEYHFVFATSFSNEQASSHVGIMSTARLDTRVPNYPNEQNSEQTARRLYKMVLKSVARLAGLKSPDICGVLAFPRTLEQLDQKSAAFCPDDRAALVAAGILKREEEVGAGCALMSQREMPVVGARVSLVEFRDR
jgi:predicted Zn-dependent protease